MSATKAHRKPARIYRGTPSNVLRLACALRRGELVAVPTETVYGLAADALNPKACRAIFRAKGRPTADPLIVHIHSWSQLEMLAESNEAARKLANAFWPGALTLVLPKKATVDDIVTSGLPSVAIRMPGHALFRRLLKQCDRPLAAPSANPFGYVSPTTAQHVKAGLGSRIRHILDGGSCAIGLESTIVDLRDPKSPRLLRPGLIDRRSIEAVLGLPVAVGAIKAKTSAPQVAPGLLKRHYSPRTPIVLHASLQGRPWQTAPADEAWLLLAKPAGRCPKNVSWLDAHGDLRGAARRLFGMLRDLDASGFRKIHAETATGTGLADAINDRLRRAAGK
ncbi:MAG: L-threonylcarbamoyladenylate synthase [Opitutaceae bacterium]